MNIGLIERHLLFLNTIYAIYDINNATQIFTDLICPQLQREGFFCKSFGNPNIFFSAEKLEEFLYYLIGVQVKNLVTEPQNIDYPLPYLTIITPIFNSERYFEHYLNNISQIYYPKDLLRIIIVDDGSYDKEAVKSFVKELQKAFKVYCISRRENRGVFYSKMEGAKEADTNFLVFLDIDDYYEKYHLFLNALHIQHLQKEENSFFISVPNILITPDGKYLDIWKTRTVDNPLELVFESAITLSGKISVTSSIVERDMVVKAYDILYKKYRVLDMVPKLSASEDTLLINQMVLLGFIKKIYSISYTGRGHVRHQSNTSSNFQRRVSEAPLRFAVDICGLIKIFGSEAVATAIQSNIEILERVLLTKYVKAKNFVLEKMKEYLKIICDTEGVNFSEILSVLENIE